MTEPVPEYGGCPWPVDSACFTEEWEALTPEVQERALAFASETLYRLTGYRVGGCPVTVRPCKKSCADGYQSYWGVWNGTWMDPHIGVNGTWINSCGCHTDCSCTQLCEVVLPAPVGEVHEVVVDGTIQATDTYRVDGNRLVWVGDGDCPWPVCQDLALPDTEPGTFSVTYLNSYPVDALGAYAAGVMANEFAKACAGSNKCRLPANVVTVTRMGVTFDVVGGIFQEGTTGIREVDAFIALWNPQPLRQQTKVWTPDIRSPRVMR